MPRDILSENGFTVTRTMTNRARWARVRGQMDATRCYRSPLGSYAKSGIRLFDSALDVFGAGLRLTGLARLGQRNALDVKVRCHSLQIAELPAAFAGFRLLQITDPHFDMINGLGDAICKAVRDAGEVDIMVLTGDYRAADDGDHFQILPDLENLLAASKSRLGAWGILGNHDDQLMLPSFEAAGLNMLVNEQLFLEKDGALLQVTGLDDVHMYCTEDASRALELQEGAIGIALVHSPEFAEEAAAAGYHLYLAGHTHGGQICLPGGRALVTHLHKGQDFAKGQWSCGAMQGVTSNGAGASGLPVRFTCPPEINLITLNPD